MKIFLIILLLLIPLKTINKTFTFSIRKEVHFEKQFHFKKYRPIYKLLPYLNNLDSVTVLNILSEAVIESGWGKSSLSTKHNNYFGIKGKDVEMNTFEYKSGELYYCKQTFKSFKTIEECVIFKLTRIKKMGTCPQSKYDSLKQKVKLIISKDLYITFL
jgi:uncharacterized FlgJ-related protein